MNLDNYTPSGWIEGFPKEVIAKMLEYQLKQTGKEDVTVFERRKYENAANGGFDWDLTREGHAFWSQVIDKQKFELFFSRYPKSTPQRGDVVLVRNSESEKWIERTFVTKLEEYTYPYLCVSVGSEKSFSLGGDATFYAWKNMKPINKEELIVEMTLQEVADKMGIDVKHLRIKEK